MKKEVLPTIMNQELFEIKEPSDNFHHQYTYFRKEYVQNLSKGPDIILNNIETLGLLNTCKRYIKSWKPDKCPCRLCKSYIYQLRFVGSAYTFS